MCRPTHRAQKPVPRHTADRVNAPHALTEKQEEAPQEEAGGTGRAQPGGATSFEQKRLLEPKWLRTEEEEEEEQKGKEEERQEEGEEEKKDEDEDEKRRKRRRRRE